nr:hypothetical protein [Nonomuraea coxensis]
MRAADDAVDGVSLTVAEIVRDRLSVALIPSTLAGTTLASLSAGDRVNCRSSTSTICVPGCDVARQGGGQILLGWSGLSSRKPRFPLGWITKNR